LLDQPGAACSILKLLAILAETWSSLPVVAAVLAEPSCYDGSSLHARFE